MLKINNGIEYLLFSNIKQVEETFAQFYKYGNHKSA